MLPTKEQSLHHAYVIEGNPEINKQAIFSFLSDRFNLELGNQDFFLIEASMFGVDEAEQVVAINGRKAFNKKEKGVVIIADAFSHQAQNALLKTLEEPYPGTYTFILTSSASTFLPTVLSRVQVIRLTGGKEGTEDTNTNKSGKAKSKVFENGGEHSSELDSAKFLKASRVSRLSMVKDIMKLKEKEHIGDREIFTFLSELEEKAHAAVLRNENTALSLEVARVMTTTADFMRDTSSSKKMLLEYAALRLPLL